MWVKCLMLTELGLPAFLKTSGGKGLHVVVPIAPRWDFDTVKAFSQQVVQHLARTIPQRFVAKSGPANRVGKVFVDYLSALKRDRIRTKLLKRQREQQRA